MIGSCDFGVLKFRRLLAAGSFTLLVQFLMGFVGSALAGNMLGETELSGVSLLLPLASFLSFVASLFGVGTGICYSLEQGKGDRRRACEIFSQGLWSVLIVGTLLSLAFATGYPLVLDCFNPSDAVRLTAVPCFRAYALVPFVELVSFFLQNACFADGDDRLCYAACAVQMAVNVAVTWAAIKLGFGTAGCAVGILAGFAASAAILSVHFLKKSNSFRLVRHFRFRDSCRIVSTVFGDSSSYLFQSMLFFSLEKYVIGHYGSGLLPVLAVVTATIGILDLFGGVGAAAQPIASVYVGERNTRATRAVMTDAMKVVCIEVAVATAVLVAAPRLVISLAGVTDPALVATASRAVRILSLGFVGLALANLLNGYYIIVGHGVLSTVISGLGWLVFPVALVFLLEPFGSNGIWLALGLGPLLAVLAVAVYIIRVHGWAMCPLLLLPERDAKIFRWSLPLEPEAVTEAARLVSEQMEASGAGDLRARTKARLLVEDALMVVRERNGGSRVLAEVTLDLNDGDVRLTLRDDGEIFDITDADARLSSFRTYVVCTVMAHQRQRENLITTGFNRNVFRFTAEDFAKGTIA